MTGEPTPKRLLEESSVGPELRALLGAATQDGPTAQQLERLALRMAPMVGVGITELMPASLPQGVAPRELAPAPPAPVGQLGATKLAGSAVAKLVAVTCAVGLGLWIWADGRPAPAPLSAPQSVVVAPAPSALDAPELQPSAPRIEPVPAPALTTPVKPAARPRKTLPQPARPDELGLIQEAQALRGQAAAMLKVLAEHERLYPQGFLSQEREVLAIEALVALGRTDEARARARRIEARFPSSAHLPRVRALLGEGPGR